jgi:hypothetical protein
VAAGWRYQIVEPETGGVWKWDAGSSSWTVPSGADTSRIGVTVTPQNFHASARENLPTYVKRYGRYMIGDAVCSEVFTELYKFINVLLWTKVRIDWVADAVDGTPENNGATSSGSDSGCGGTGAGCPPTDTCETAKAQAAALWAPAPGGDGVAPFATSSSNFTQFVDPCYPDDGCHEYGVSRMSSYGKADGLCTRQACAVDFYDFASGPAGLDVTAGCVGGNRRVFNSFGDAVAYQAWKKFGSVGAAVRSSARVKLGSSSMPDGSYEDGVTCFGRAEGYQVMDGCAIVKWNVPGGFQFQP